jgi:L-amino acid N-acyltransferase YncA|tara:strand:- start:11310 stop:11798 length:489 start_codon:yes stop_codon:yes gene_type:complete
MEIRKGTIQNLPSILEILNYEIENSTSVYDENPRSLETIQLWFEEKNSLNFPVFVALENDKVLGYGTIGKFRPHDGYRFSVEHSIYVHKDSRGKGIGHLLLEKLIDSSKELGYHSMIAGIDASNEKSCKFHAEFGFVEVGRLKEVGFKFGKWLDLVFMQKIL